MHKGRASAVDIFGNIGGKPRELQHPGPVEVNVREWAITESAMMVLAEAEPRRVALGIYSQNDNSTNYVYVMLGEGASTTRYVVRLGPDDYFEIPARYTGRVTAYSTDSGEILVAEYVRTEVEDE